jgi:hypothetical protein
VKEIMKIFSLFLLSLLMNFFLFNPEALAQYYRYVDEDGITHFTIVPADPRYKPASGAENRKVPKKPKQSKSKKHPQSAHPKPVERSNQATPDQMYPLRSWRE